MSPRGRKAALPDGIERRPAVRVPGTLRIAHRDKKGRTSIFDFATMPCPAPMQASIAELFGAKCTREGGWNSHRTSNGCWQHLSTFVTWLSEQAPQVNDLDDLTAGVWKKWRLSRPTTVHGYNEVTVVARLLRDHPTLSPAAREAMTYRMPQVKTEEQSYKDDEFTKIKAAARRSFRTAHLRIMDNAAHLAAWRSGAFEEGSTDWLVGEALECLARTGAAPTYLDRSGHWRVTNRYIRALGGASASRTWHRLFLSRPEAVALAVLLATEHGFNTSTISDLAMPRATPDPGEDGHPIYRLELAKDRRSNGRHFETRNLADFGADSPGRLITQALEATAFARALIREQKPDLDRLLVWRLGTSREEGEHILRAGVFGVGLTESGAYQWAKAAGLSGSPFRRTRRTVNTRHRREPGQNTQDTHDSVYVLPDKQVQEDAVPQIADGAVDALESARKTVLVAQLRDEPDPDDLETATADCHDYTHSHFTPHGTGCGASFLMCLACPNARIHPGHHPRLAHLHHVLDSLHSVMDPGQWRTDWHDTHARLAHLKAELGEATWQQALADVTDADRHMIEHLLHGDFNQ